MSDFLWQGAVAAKVTQFSLTRQAGNWFNVCVRAGGILKDEACLVSFLKYLADAHNSG